MTLAVPSSLNLPVVMPETVSFIWITELCVTVGENEVSARLRVMNLLVRIDGIEQAHEAIIQRMLVVDGAALNKLVDS